MPSTPKFEPLSIPGAWEITHPRFDDSRGWLMKHFEAEPFARHGLPVEFAEDLIAFSRPGVVRGMHFQTPPHGQAKLVCCILGEVLDVLVDLRVGSPTYHQVVARKLSGDRGNALFAPVGLAHGYIVLSETALVHYKLSHAYSSEHSLGIRWDSIDFAWPAVQQTLLSPRDDSWPALADFRSPFRYEGPR